MLMIDAHFHLEGRDLPERMLSDGADVGVTEFVGCSLGNYEEFPTSAQTTAANDDMAAVIRRHQNVHGYCYVNPRHGRTAHEDFRRRLEDDGFVGLKLWVATLADDPLVFPFVETAIEHRLPVLVHAWRKTFAQMRYESTASNVEALAARYPEARLIMAHLGGQVESAMAAVQNMPNVRVDTSGTPIGQGEVSLAVRRLGAERVIFGTDAPGATIAGSVGKILDAGLTPEEWELVTHGNMRVLLDEVKR